MASLNLELPSFVCAVAIALLTNTNLQMAYPLISFHSQLLGEYLRMCNSAVFPDHANCCQWLGDKATNISSNPWAVEESRKRFAPSIKI